MTDFSITKQVTGEAIDTRWRAQRHGQETTVPGTLDVAAFNGTVAKGALVKSGTGLSKLANKKYGPYKPGVAEGQPGYTLDGYLNDDSGVVLTDQATCAVLKHGVIEPAYLPIAGQRAAVKAAKTTGSFIYIED